jgi:hypothetical protein
MSERVNKAKEAIREAIHRARQPLTKAEDLELLEELVADAEGWDMELKEAEREARKAERAVVDHDEEEE